MKYILTILALVVVSVTSVLGAANLINGNWYGDAVERIIYTGWGSAGTYNEVIDMSNGQCLTEEISYSGGMSPLDSELSWHFRGPMHLKQFAFYSPDSSDAKRNIKSTLLHRRHGHGHHKRAIGDVVTATINGQVVTWRNNYASEATQAPSAASTTPTSAGAAATNAPAPIINPGAGNWGRHAYYNAVNGTADGLVFLNNMGGEGSGVFDTIYGNSLSYAASDARTGSASPQVLSDTLLDDSIEVAIYTDKACEGDSCGAYRPGSVAYHGFDGESKMFLLEFDMPMSGKTGWNMNMPGVWVLNAAIARTQQYGNCSCWASGCGEWDIFEILDSGNTRAKSTLHAGDASGGESDYFERPVSKTMKVAVVFDSVDNTGHIIVLPDTTKFDTVITDEAVAKFGSPGHKQLLTKVFELGA